MVIMPRDNAAFLIGSTIFRSMDVIRRDPVEPSSSVIAMNPVKPLAEFIGTFGLALTIGMAGLEPGSAGAWAPAVIALVLTILILLFARVSGSHFNPVVTLALVWRGDCRWHDAIPYMIVQVVAATAGGLLSLTINDAMTAGELVVAPMELVILPSVLLDALFAYALVHVTFIITPLGGHPNPRWLHVAIGVTVLVGAYLAGPVSGAAFNPAVTVGLVVMGVMGVADAWIHFAGQLAGGLVGVAVGTPLLLRRIRRFETPDGD